MGVGHSFLCHIMEGGGGGHVFPHFQMLSLAQTHFLHPIPNDKTHSTPWLLDENSEIFNGFCLNGAQNKLTKRELAFHEISRAGSTSN